MINSYYHLLQNREAMLKWVFKLTVLLFNLQYNFLLIRIKGWVLIVMVLQYLIFCNKPQIN
jgi:hypothetical protein